ncbi:MAG: tetratricopeptide repeat protein, partial [Chloroflexi bacterium]|nr:tetratricopeptide repeat protein [Chloroflexota bacterium]
MIWKAFVSHDADTGDDDASHLKESLENRGISTFIDHKDIPGGEPRDSTIFHALDHCEYFIALGTDPYLESRPIRDEIQRAHDLEKKGQIKLILPCRHDGLVERDAFLALFPGEQLWEIAYSTESDLASRVLARLKGMEYRGAQTAPMVDGMATEALKRPWRPTEEFLRQQKERLEGGEATEVIPAVEAWLKREKRDVTGATALLARAFMVEGDGYFHKGEFRAAQGLYQKGLEYAEQSPDKTLVAMAAYELGAAWGMLGYYDEALKLFDRAIAAGFKHAPAYYNRGNAYYHKKEFDAAIADYTRAIELDPKDAAAYYNRGNAYDDKKDFDAAIADYTRAIELDPNDAAAYYNRGNAHAHKKELDAAIADYTRAIE